MSEYAVTIRDLHKIYRLYTRPQYRLWDLLGLLRNREAAYSEYPALNGIDLDVRRGEKVAIIGRNGAGKSTLLKLVTMVIEPTSGTLEVTGKTQALLQIGTGFHPDFSGRENVTAYLAQVGIRGARMRALTEEIIDFAEIEGYIDQPLKTYSTGMAMRLMFASSTVLAPEILVIDEVLSVGDAYFAHKSFERIEQLCAGNGTTLLLVSHDIYNAAKLCDRMIWIDRGRVLMDDTSAEVIKAYDSFIHAQEEERLRLRALKTTTSQKGLSPGNKRFVVEMRAPDNCPMKSPVYFRDIAVSVGGRRLGEVPAGDAAFDTDLPVCLRVEGSAWGEEREWEGAIGRPFLNSGTRFHKAVVLCRAPIRDLSEHEVTVDLNYYSEAGGAMDLVLCDESVEHFLGRAQLQDGKWTRLAIDPPGRGRPATQSDNPEMRLSGSGAIWITAVQLQDGGGKESVIVRHGEQTDVVVDYRVADPSVETAFQAILAFHKDGVVDVCRVLSEPLSTAPATGGAGRLRARLARMLLGTGTYTLTVMFVKAGYYDSDPKMFYSLNPDVFCVFNRGLEFNVDKGGILGTGTSVVVRGEWTQPGAEQRAVPRAEKRREAT